MYTYIQETNTRRYNINYKNQAYFNESHHESK